MMNGRPLKASRGIVACVFAARCPFVVSRRTQSRYSVGTSHIAINTSGKSNFDNQCMSMSLKNPSLSDKLIHSVSNKNTLKIC